MADYPLFGLVTWEVRPKLLEYKEGIDTLAGQSWPRGPRRQWTRGG